MNTTRIYENQKLVYFNIARGILRFSHDDAGHTLIAEVIVNPTTIRIRLRRP
jgi:hypothetical protein